MPKSKFLPILGGAAALLLGAGMVTSATATLFVQNSDHCTPACNVNTNNTVTVTPTGAANTLDVRAQLAPGWSFVFTGGHQSFDFSETTIPQDIGTIVSTTSDAANWHFENAAVVPVGTPTAVTGATSIMDDGLTIPSDAYALDHTTSGSNIDGSFLEFTISAPGLTTSSFNLLQTNSGIPTTSVFAADVVAANGSTGVIDFAPFAAVPAPMIGHGLLALLAIGGVLFGGKLLEDLKKRHSHAG